MPTSQPPQSETVAAGCACSRLPERTLVRVSGSSAHLEDDVRQGRRLRNLPVDARRARARRHLAQVDHEVAHAPEEVVLVDVPLGAVAARDVRVRICSKLRRAHTRTHAKHSTGQYCGSSITACHPRCPHVTR